MAYDFQNCLRSAVHAPTALVLLGLFAAPVTAAKIAGKTVKVQPNANITNPEGTVTLRVGMDVEMGDRVKTDRQGEAQLLFTDDTRLVVGPNSSLIIEAYLLRSNNRANNFTVRALGGSFRMITGKSRKNAYKIKTPTATIGVRGTAFDFTVRANGETAVVLFNGEAEVCGLNRQCKVLNRRCAVAQAPRKEDVRVLREIENRNRQIKRNFPYVTSQQSLRRDFRVRTSSCGELSKVIDPKEQRRPRAQQPPVTPALAPPTPPPPPEPDPGHNHGHNKPGYSGKSGNVDGHKNGNNGSGKGKDKSDKGKGKDKK